MERTKLQQAVQNRLRKRLEGESGEQSNTGPETDLQKIISQLDSEEEEIEQNNYQQSFNDSYLKSPPMSTMKQGSESKHSNLDMQSFTDSISLENKYDSNYPSINQKYNNKSNSSNLEQQLSDLEHVYNQITPRINSHQLVDSLQLSKNLQYEYFTANEPSILAEKSQSIAKQINQPIVQMYQNIDQTHKKNNKIYQNLPPKTHSDHSFDQQEKLITNLQKECDRLQQPKQNQQQTQSDQILTNLRHKLNSEVYDHNNTKLLVNRLKDEFQQTMNENQKMKKMFADIISELYDVDAEVDANKMLFDVINIIKNNKSNNEEIYKNKINEAVTDLQALQILLQEKDKELLYLKNKIVQNAKETLKPQVTGSNTNIMKEIEKRDQQISKQLTEISSLQVKLIQLSPQKQEDTDMLKQQIQQLEQMRELDKSRIKSLEKEHFEQKLREDEFNEQRIRQIRFDYDKANSELKIQIRNTESQIANERCNNQELKQELQILKENNTDSKLNEIQRRLEAADKPLAYSNQMVERAVIAERRLREETEKFERVLLDKEQKLSGFEIELDELIKELEGLI
ncbi:hypothetical protein SS50377_23361 [Spironucleus salmonicida]|uniref:Uncharacterized protein n=1 Tax=Spironucleus salmonicida TaxID=348837 RepID=V6LRF5_9EUKA|nr:hypothetical protein SS50377_23361 [Spironucleus salmonicida]|eukprot:EST47232.1 Hypothetical protein SS50377_12742 [Spironucleus salmonicida]